MLRREIEGVIFASDVVLNYWGFKSGINCLLVGMTSRGCGCNLLVGVWLLGEGHITSCVPH